MKSTIDYRKWIRLLCMVYIWEATIGLFISLIYDDREAWFHLLISSLSNSNLSIRMWVEDSQDLLYIHWPAWPCIHAIVCLDLTQHLCEQFDACYSLTNNRGIFMGTLSTIKRCVFHSNVDTLILTNYWSNCIFIYAVRWSKL